MTFSTYQLAIISIIINMNFKNFTIKAQEAIQQASEIAEGKQQQAIETAHLLKGLLTVDENVVSYVLKKLNVNLGSLNQELDTEISRFPKVTGGSQVYLSKGANSALQKAQSFLKEFNDEFVSVEHLLLGLLSVSDGASRILKAQGVNEKDLKKAISELRDIIKSAAKAAILIILIIVFDPFIVSIF